MPSPCPLPIASHLLLLQIVMCCMHRAAQGLWSEHEFMLKITGCFIIRFFFCLCGGGQMARASLPLFIALAAVSVKFLSFPPTEFLPSPHHSSPPLPPSPLSVALFLACTLILSLSHPPSHAVLLTYFMAHRQRQEECLLLSVVSRSVGQRRRMRASFLARLCFALPPSPLQVFMKMIRVGGGTDPTFFHICCWLRPNPCVLSVAVLQFIKESSRTCLATLNAFRLSRSVLLAQTRIL